MNLIIAIAVLSLLITIISFFIKIYNGTWEDFWLMNLKKAKEKSQTSISHDDEVWLASINKKRKNINIIKTLIDFIILPILLFSFFYPFIRLASSELIQINNTTYRKAINEPLVIICFCVLGILVIYGITYAILGGWRNKKIKPENETTAQGIVYSNKITGRTDNALYYRALIAVRDLDELLVFKETIYQSDDGKCSEPLKIGEKITLVYDHIKPKACRVIKRENK